MAFIDTLRETQKYTQDDTKRRSDIIEEWDKISKQFTDSYNSYLKNTGRKEISGVTARQKLRDFIGKAGVEDGKWSSDDYSNSDYDEYDDVGKVLMITQNSGMMWHEESLPTYDTSTDVGKVLMITTNGPEWGTPSN